MATLDQLNFQNSFYQLGTDFYTEVEVRPLQNPHLVSANPAAAKLIDLDIAALTSNDFLQVLSGNQTLNGSQPLSMVYAGHQFGGYSPKLGDGRGLLLGEVVSQQYGKWDLHLKGAGLTPYSRFGDGYAVLRSSIREYLGSEAIAGLGIATTRALCVIGSESPVRRETMETAATLLRLSKSHVRFGHFEYFHHTGRTDAVKQLADYVIEQHHPDLVNDGNKYLHFFERAVTATAQLIAQWQACGFAHGVMNTDNMSIIGETLDYGPFAFLDDFDVGFICNHSDDQGRYAFNKQPGIGLWNLTALAQALTSLISVDDLKAGLAYYESELYVSFNQLMFEKIGLINTDQSDPTLLDDLLTLLHEQRCDYTCFFRRLCDVNATISSEWFSDLFADHNVIDPWLKQYQQYIQQQNLNDADRQAAMKQRNPKYILRNYLAQRAIEKAQQKQDFTEVDTLLKLVQSPFDEHPGFEDYAKPAPGWGKQLEISCSS
jgi:uncharacterized protein YdiU (UPF0061 family)